MTVTQQDVAKEAGVSQPTANFVLNGRWKEMKISEKSAQKVLETAHRLGYRQNYHAQALQTGKSQTFGLMIPQTLLGNYFGQELQRGAQQRVSELGYNLLVFGPADPHKALDSLAEQRIDGLLMFHSGYGLDDNSEKRWPLVLIQRPAVNGYPSVILDPEPGIRQASEHLAELGHKKVMYLGLKEDDKERASERRVSFLKSAEKVGIDTEEIFISRPKGFNLEIDAQLDWYINEVEKELAYSDDVTAIMCYNDFVALALCSVLGKRGVRVPEDMSVIGFDNFYAQFAIPSLTTVSHMLPEIGARAVDLLVEINKKEIEYPHEAEIKVLSELVVKKSTGPAVQGSI